MKLKLQFLLLTAVAFISNSAFAVTKTWTGTSSTSWTTSGNWSPSGAPASGDDVIINSAGSNRPTTNVSGTIKSLTMNSASGTLTLTGNMTITGLLNLNGGSFNLSTRTLTVADMTLTSGTFTANANQTISGTLTVSGGSYTLTSTTNTFSAANVIITTGTLTLPSNLTVSGTLTLNGGSLNKNGRTLTVADVMLTNGTLTSTSNQTIGGTLTLNGGSITLTTGTNTLTAADVDVTSGTFSLPNNLTVNNILTLNGGSLTVNSKTLTVTDIVLTSGTLALGGTTVNPSGNLTLSGGTFSMGGASVTLGGNITVTANSTISSTGISMFNSTGNTLTINGGNLTLDNVELVTDNLAFSTNNDINDVNGGFLSFDNSQNHTLTSVDNGSHVNAKVRLYTNSGNNNTFLFPIGDGTIYSPFIFTPTSVTGSGTFTRWIEATYVGAISPNKTLDINTLNSASGNEYWIVATSGANVTGTMGLRFDNNASKTGKTLLNSTSNVNTDLKIAEFKTSNSKWTGITSSASTNSNITTVSSSVATLNTMYTLASNNARTGFAVPLPVTLLSFAAVANNESKTVELKWETASEENNHHFELLHTSDFVNWTTIATINGKGTSNDLSSYSFIHTNPSAVNHYQLKEVAGNGDFSLSDIKLARFSDLNDARISFFPNPAGETLNISYSGIDSENPATIQLINQLGQIVMVKTTENQFSTIDISGLAAGIYKISIAGSNLAISEKLIIAH